MVAGEIWSSIGMDDGRASGRAEESAERVSMHFTPSDERNVDGSFRPPMGAYAWNTGVARIRRGWASFRERTSIAAARIVASLKVTGVNCSSEYRGPQSCQSVLTPPAATAKRSHSSHLYGEMRSCLGALLCQTQHLQHPPDIRHSRARVNYGGCRIFVLGCSP